MHTLLSWFVGLGKIVQLWKVRVKVVVEQAKNTRQCNGITVHNIMPPNPSILYDIKFRADGGAAIPPGSSKIVHYTIHARFQITHFTSATIGCWPAREFVKGARSWGGWQRWLCNCCSLEGCSVLNMYEYTWVHRRGIDLNTAVLHIHTTNTFRTENIHVYLH